jgi:hypothetical protein
MNRNRSARSPGPSAGSGPAEWSRAPSGYAVMPRTWTRRVPTSMAKNILRNAPSSQSTDHAARVQPLLRERNRLAVRLRPGGAPCCKGQEAYSRLADPHGTPPVTGPEGTLSVTRARRRAFRYGARARRFKRFKNSHVPTDRPDATTGNRGWQKRGPGAPAGSCRLLANAASPVVEGLS